MEEYMKAQLELQKQKDKLTERLAKILEKNEMKPHLAWFNFYKNKTIVWGNCNISLKILNDLQDEFGEIRCVYCTKGSNNLFIRFKDGGK